MPASLGYSIIVLLVLLLTWATSAGSSRAVRR